MKPIPVRDARAPAVHYDPAAKQLTVRLEGLSEADAGALFAHLGRFLQAHSDRAFCCLGTHILAEVGQGVPAPPCVFCAIARKRVEPGDGEGVRACPF